MSGPAANMEVFFFFFIIVDVEEMMVSFVVKKDHRNSHKGCANTE